MQLMFPVIKQLISIL